MNVVDNKYLMLLEQVVFSTRNYLVHQFGFLSPSHDLSELTVNRDYLKELSYNVVQLSESIYDNITNLNFEKVKSISKLLEVSIQILYEFSSGCSW